MGKIAAEGKEGSNGREMEVDGVEVNAGWTTDRNGFADENGVAWKQE